MIGRAILSSVCALTVMLPALGAAQRPDVAPVRVDALAEKLGVKGMPSGARELDLGQSATMVLAEPAKLEPYGIKGMHEGARITITCVGPSRLRVEADEMTPVEQRKTITVRVDSDGTLTPTPDRPPPAKPPAK